MAKIERKQGDTITVSETFERPGSRSSQALDLSDAQSVQIYVDHPSSGDLVVNDTAEITDDANGMVEYTLGGTQTARQGIHRLEFVAEFGGGETFSYPQTGFVSLKVTDPAARELPIEELADGDASVTELAADAIRANTLAAGEIDSAQSVTISDDETVTYGRDHVHPDRGIEPNSVAIGVGARAPDTTGDPDWFNDTANSVAIGYQALRDNTGANSNGVGYRALANNTGFGSNGVGHEALRDNTGDKSNGVGREALRDNTGDRSNGVGYYALRDNTGDRSNGVGYYALRGNTGDKSNGVGYRALRYNTGDKSNGVGYYALLDNTGFGSNGVGHRALANNTGDRSNGVGYEALRDNTGFGSNGVGYRALRHNTGDRSNGVGHRALEGDGLSNPSDMGSNVNAFGYEAGRNNTGEGVILIGQQAGINNSEDDVLLITDRNGETRLKMDLTNGNMEIGGSLSENATLN